MEDVYLPNRVVASDPDALDIRFDILQMPALTVGRLSFGPETRVTTTSVHDYYVNVPLTGLALSASGNQPAECTGPGQAALFAADRPAAINWSDGLVQLCVMIPRAALESALEETLGTNLRAPVCFDPVMDLSTAAGRGWREALDVFVAELDAGEGLATHPMVGRHLERVVIDGLLVGHRHNYTEQLTRGPHFASSAAIHRARDLLTEQPQHDWSTTRLAAAVHLSVRSLHEGFAREVGTPPMTYLRQVRMQRAHQTLMASDPDQTNVADVALDLGFGHLGRFAAAYRTMFGEAPSETLRRPSTAAT